MKKYSSFLGLILFLSLAGCKDGKVEPVAFEAKDLIQYYMPVVTDNNRLQVLYFAEQNSVILAYADLVGVRRVATDLLIDKENLTVKFNYNGGVTTFHFRMKRDEEGYLELAEGYWTLDEGERRKLTQAYIFRNIASELFIQGTNDYASMFPENNLVMTLSSENPYALRWNQQNQFGSFAIYPLGNYVGFKTENEIMMGVAVPEWDGEAHRSLLIQSSSAFGGVSVNQIIRLKNV